VAAAVEQADEAIEHSALSPDTVTSLAYARCCPERPFWSSLQAQTGTLSAISPSSTLRRSPMQPFEKKEHSVERGAKLGLRVLRSTLAMCMLAAAALVGCSETNDIHRPYTFTYVKSGGFAGVYEQLVVESGERRLSLHSRSGDRKTAEATEADLWALEDKLQKANFMNIQKSYRCTSCADQFVYEATLKMVGIKEHKVHWEDDSGAPSELTAIGELSGTLIREKFEPTTPIPRLTEPAGAL
jgi:hypothetical protein